jgi:hypothetical protein
MRQRWLLVESEARAREEEEGLRRRVARAEGEADMKSSCFLPLSRGS